MKRRQKYAAGYPIMPWQRDRIITPVHMALAALELGHGNAYHYDTLAAFSGLAGEMALRMNTDPETLAAMEAGRLAVASAGRRYMETGKFGFSGPEMLAVRSMVTLGDRLLKRGNSAIVMGIMAAVDEHMRQAA